MKNYKEYTREEVVNIARAYAGLQRDIFPEVYHFPMEAKHLLRYRVPKFKREISKELHEGLHISALEEKLKNIMKEVEADRCLFTTRYVRVPSK